MSDSTMQPVPSTDTEANIETNIETNAKTNSGESSQGTVGVFKSDGVATILVHNDDVTPYEYVTDMLSDLFMLSEEMADHIAWTAHTKGSAVVVVRPRVEALKLVRVARGRARMARYPLTFSIEQK